jgi:hypothetical protein
LRRRSASNRSTPPTSLKGIEALVAPQADRRKEPRPGRRGGIYDVTGRLLATDSGRELSLKRQLAAT